MITLALSTRFDEAVVKPYVRRPWQVMSNEAELRAALHQAQLVGETIATYYLRVEHELASLLSTLSVGESRELHRRLSSPASDDVLAKRFERLVVDRRHRLLVFLSNAPRRVAMRGLRHA